MESSKSLLVGVSAKPVNRPILSLNRKPKSRVESALNPIDLTVLAEYHKQIESNLQRIERKNQRTWYSKPGERGITCSGRQKIKENRFLLSSYLDIGLGFISILYGS
jgi:hypothetical protein